MAVKTVLYGGSYNGCENSPIRGKLKWLSLMRSKASLSLDEVDRHKVDVTAANGA